MVVACKDILVSKFSNAMLLPLQLILSSLVYYLQPTKTHNVCVNLDMCLQSFCYISGGSLYVYMRVFCETSNQWDMILINQGFSSYN